MQHLTSVIIIIIVFVDIIARQNCSDTKRNNTREPRYTRSDANETKIDYYDYYYNYVHDDDGDNNNVYYRYSF